MKKYLYMGLAVIVALIGVYCFYLGYRHNKDSFKTLDYSLKGDEIAAVVVNNRTLSTVDNKGHVKDIELPRKGEARIGIDEEGNLEVQKPSAIQISGFLGLEYDSKTIEPTVGVQLVQWHKIGLSGEINSKGISLGIEYDVYNLCPMFQNTFVGLSYRLGSESSICFLLGVYL